MDDIQFTSVISWDIRKGSTIVRAVRFMTFHILLSENRYRVCGSDWSVADGNHLLKNLSSGEYRWVRGVVVRGWLDREVVK